MTFDNSFIDFVTNLFPSISPYVQEQTKSSLEQFYEHGKTFECYNVRNLGGICQGDIIENVSFPKFDDEGNFLISNRTVLVISNSCDIENDDTISVAPFYTFAEAGFNRAQISELQKNVIYNKIYFPDVSEEPVFADLSMIQSLPKSYFIKALENRTMNIKYSLNMVGYYLFLCKLTIHFMHPEDKDLQDNRERIDFVEIS